MTKFLALALAVCAAPLSAQLNSIKTVYVLPMGGGLDQYMANRLTAAGFFQVVTDPQIADAVFTDRLGEAFEARFHQLYIAPEEEKRTKAEAEAKKTQSKDSDKDEKSADTAGSLNIVDKSPPRFSSFGRGRGTMFLVERKSRSVIWSVYEQPRGSTPKELNRVASRVVERLKKDLNPAK